MLLCTYEQIQTRPRGTKKGNIPNHCPWTVHCHSWQSPDRGGWSSTLSSTYSTSTLGLSHDTQFFLCLRPELRCVVVNCDNIYTGHCVGLIDVQLFSIFCIVASVTPTECASVGPTLYLYSAGSTNRCTNMQYKSIVACVAALQCVSVGPYCNNV